MRESEQYRFRRAINAIAISPPDRRSAVVHSGTVVFPLMLTRPAESTNNLFIILSALVKTRISGHQAGNWCPEMVNQ
jgi:hypothetical protein